MTLVREPNQAYQRLWQEIQGCRRCLTAPSIGPLLRKEPVFIPVPVPRPRPPKAPVTYLLVAAEPSASWATSQADAESKIAAGSRNFTQSRHAGVFVLQYAVEHWLLRQGEGYAITDLAKCAMSTAAATVVRTKCYELCAPFLERELALLQPRAVIGIGKKVGGWLKERALSPVVFQIAHYSRVAQAHWPKIDPSAALPRLDDFQAFIDQRRMEIPMRSPRPVATGIDLRLLGVYRQQLSEIRRNVRARYWRPFCGRSSRKNPQQERSPKRSRCPSGCVTHSRWISGAPASLCPAPRSSPARRSGH